MASQFIIMGKFFFEIVSKFNSIATIDKMNGTYTFCAYKNGAPGSGKSEQRIIIRDKQLTLDFIEEQLSDLQIGWELAFSSLVTFNHSRYHVPLIDFYCDELDSVIIDSLREIKQEYGGQIYLFDTGRSFHGYHDILITQHKFGLYLGSLLLLNKRGFLKEIIDTRWVGHSLKQEYSSLRISDNTETYIKLPEFVAKI